VPVCASEQTTFGVTVILVAIHMVAARFTSALAHQDGAREAVAVNKGARHMSLGTILLIVLILMLIGALPKWPHARNWGYFPSGIVGVILLIVIVLFLMGRL
jgi:Protein of unknown function (DUF3309)